MSWCVVSPVCLAACVSCRLCVLPPVCRVACVSCRLCVVSPVCRVACVSCRLCVVSPVCRVACVSCRLCVVWYLYFHYLFGSLRVSVLTMRLHISASIYCMAVHEWHCWFCGTHKEPQINTGTSRVSEAVLLFSQNITNVRICVRM